ncbi:MAG TPA: hypothetical protein VGE97_05105 [Nitrososphaera sp.]|jgi:hypothetical protein
MHVNVNITLDEGDNLAMSPDEIAIAVLQGLNGDPNKDVVLVTVQPRPEAGSAGMVIDPADEVPAS